MMGNNVSYSHVRVQGFNILAACRGNEPKSYAANYNRGLGRPAFRRGLRYRGTLLYPRGSLLLGLKT